MKNKIIKNPTSAGGVQILLQSKAKSIKGNYTKTFNTKFALCKNNLVNNCKTFVFTCFARVIQTAKSGKNKYYNLQNILKNLTNQIIKGIFAIIITYSGNNRTRETAVFLRPLYLFGLFIPFFYGGLRKGNINNTFHRLYAVIETHHPIKKGGGLLLKHIGGHHD